VPLLGWSIDHRNGVTTIYAASIALWAFGVLAPIIEFVRTSGVLAPTLEFLRRVPFDLGLPGLAVTVVVNIIALALAIGLTVLGLLIIWKHKKRREKKLGRCAAEAVETATSIPVECVEKLLLLCKDLSGKTRGTIRSRAQFYTTAKSVGYYLPFGSRQATAAHIVALLTDMPARWLLDCATNRRGALIAQTGRQLGLVDALAKYWWLLLLRGIAAIIFGVLAFAWPGITLLTLVPFYGAYALVDGVLAIIAASIGGAPAPRWWLAIIGLLGIAAGLLTLLPGRSALVLLIFIAGWAIATGVFQIIGAIKLRKEIDNERLLILGGIISVLFGIVMMLTRGTGALALVWTIGTYELALGALAFWVIGTYAVTIGGLLVALAFRLKKRAHFWCPCVTTKLDDGWLEWHGRPRVSAIDVVRAGSAH
jgi:uncharacterized membrane protein HdeD (DUF308 family)